MTKASCKYYNKRNTTRDNGSFQSCDQEECKLNSTINVNSGAYMSFQRRVSKST